MEEAGGVVAHVADGVVVQVAGHAVVEVAGGGAGGPPAEAAVPGQWARCMEIFFFRKKPSPRANCASWRISAERVHPLSRRRGLRLYRSTESPSPRANSR
jgi:hypothetical protein